MYRRILVPLDGSSRAETILPHVEELALRFEAEVVLLHVDESPGLLLERDEVVDMSSYMERRRREIEDAQTYLQGIVDRWRERNISARTRIGRGSVSACIVDTAKRESADLLAMASHGRSGVQRTFYGSVAAAVLHRIDRPILVVRSRLSGSSVVSGG